MSAAEVQMVLSEADRLKLISCEAVVSQGLQTFVEIGEALKVIRDRRLYRASHSTFEAYCESRWGMKRQRAYDFIEASTTVENVRLTDKTAEGHMSVLPDKTAALELAKLPSGEQAKAWDQVIEETDGKPTVKATREVVERSKPKPTKFIPDRQQPTLEAEDESQDFGDAWEEPQVEPEPISPRGKTLLNGVISDDPPFIARKRAEGKILADTVPIIDDSAEPTPADETPVREAGEEEPESDTDWLGTLPARGKLSDRCRRIFDADATLYRTLAEPRKSLAHHASRAMSIASRGGGIGAPYYYRVERFMRTEHPKTWSVCPPLDKGGCAGTGEVTLIGECPKCRGRGYWII